MQTEVEAISQEIYPAKQSAPSRIMELDGLRGVAALAVFCHHILFRSVSHPEQLGWLSRLAVGISQAGAYGVGLFFVLSGFLITSILLGDRSKPNFYWNFYWRRALRILPLYGGILLWLAIVAPPTRRYVLLAALFLANFEHLFHLNSWGPFWTLAIEEQFYLFWPRVLKNLAHKSVERVAIGVALGSLAFRLIDTMFGHHNYRYTFFHCDGLALGALLACQLSVLRSQPIAEGGRAHTEIRLLLGTAAMGALLAALPSAFDVNTRIGITLEAFRLSGVTLLAYVAVRTSVVFSGARFLAILRARGLTFFGLISYALYLLHEFVMNFYTYGMRRLHVGGTIGFWIRFVEILAITVALSLISRYGIELPAMSLRRFVLRKGDKPSTRRIR